MISTLPLVPANISNQLPTVWPPVPLFSLLNASLGFKRRKIPLLPQFYQSILLAKKGLLKGKCRGWRGKNVQAIWQNWSHLHQQLSYHHILSPDAIVGNLHKSPYWTTRKEPGHQASQHKSNTSEIVQKFLTWDPKGQSRTECRLRALLMYFPIHTAHKSTLGM